MARAVMEGVAFHMAWIIEAMEKLGLPIKHINAIGGGATSPTWTQIMSDVIGRPLHIVEHPLEAGAIGAALTVAVGMGVYPNMEAVDDLIKISRVVEPNAGNANRYHALYSRYRDTYDALAPIFRNLHGA
jgi:xylulokinase